MKKQPAGKVRIVGGQWRGRYLPVLSLPGLRPTPNRIRETLFNWLTTHISGASCLDIFSGTGALSFEAVSRGAADVTMIDASPVIIQQLQQNLALYKCDPSQAFTIQASIPNYIPKFSHTFDIVFIDPPFHQGLVKLACAWLEHYSLLSENALIYIEVEADLQKLIIPEHWKKIKEGHAGEVTYYLFKKENRLPPSVFVSKE